LKRFVLDASVALAWCFEDETSPEADKVLDALTSMEAVVPSIWPIEVANALLAGERRGRIAPATVSRQLTLLGQLPIQADDAGLAGDIDGLVSLARSAGLSAYDAVYLSLAQRKGIPLATLDSALSQAARRSGIELLI
jgi:predicted nucleic acid-binding protein